MLLRYPNGGYENIVSEPVSSIDIMPTLCDMFDISVDGVDGQSFHSLLRGESNQSHRIVSEDGGGRIAVQHDGWKYIQPRNDGSAELYHIEKDAKEMENLVNEKQEKVDKLTSIIDELRDGTQ